MTHTYNIIITIKLKNIKLYTFDLNCFGLLEFIDFSVKTILHIKTYSFGI